MRARKWKITIVVCAVLTGGAAGVLGDTAATVNPAAITWTNIDQETSIGYRFFVDKTMTITHLGLFDSISGPGAQNGPGLVGSHVAGIWRLPKAGGLELVRQVTIGPGAELSDNHAWVALDEPLTITPDPVPYYIGSVPYYEKWMVGVWTPNYLVPGLLGDSLIFLPRTAVTFNAVNAGVIRLDGYTLKDPALTFAPPWPGSPYSFHYGVNFKYSTLGPTANAGLDDTIYTSEQAVTTISGGATHPVAGTAMQYRWLEGSTVLKDWADVGADGAAVLSLAAPVAAFSVGSHTLTLEVKDAATTASDTMVLTVSNTPPEAQLAPTYQVVEIGEDAILITAEVADFDGDTLSYQWLKDGEVLDSGTMTPPAGGAIIGLDDLIIPAGDPRFPLGLNEIQLIVSDGINPSASASATTEVKDTTAPTLAPTPETTMLWPANHALVPVTIWANAVHNGGGAVSLAASVQSSEPLDDSGDGSTEEDCIVTSIDDTTGAVLVQLRAERSGTGAGRVYTVTIIASDELGNQSKATVDIRVPHDRKRR